MTTALDDRRGHVALEAACQTYSVVEVLLAQGDNEAHVRAMLIRLLALSSATMRLFDDMEVDVGQMEEIVFGEVREVEEEPSPA